MDYNKGSILIDKKTNKELSVVLVGGSYSKKDLESFSKILNTELEEKIINFNKK